MDGTTKRLISTIDYLIEINAENYSDGIGVYDGGYLNGYNDALIDVLKLMNLIKYSF